MKLGAFIVVLYFGFATIIPGVRKSWGELRNVSPWLLLGGLALEIAALYAYSLLTKAALARMIDLDAYADDQLIAAYKADGLIISTPTGSTAYSLSAGGPIVFPELNAIVINPICPHTLTNRPILLPGNAVIRVTLWTVEEGATLTLDGQVSFNVKSGDTMTIRQSRHVTTLVSSPHRGYLEILRTKLGWVGSLTGDARERQDALGTEHP